MGARIGSHFLPGGADIGPMMVCEAQPRRAKFLCVERNRRGYNGDKSVFYRSSPFGEFIHANLWR